MSDVLKRLPFLLLVGALFSAGFVPWITRYWQKRQRELEIRTGLVTVMPECVMQFPPTLVLKSEGSVVRRVQRALNELTRGPPFHFLRRTAYSSIETKPAHLAIRQP